MVRKKKDNKENEELTNFQEMLMWTSYRYCIGRHTYVTTMAYDIGKYYYDKLSDERKIFTAQDIRNEITQSLSFSSFNFSYDWSVPSKERRPIEHLIEYLMANDIHDEEGLRDISKLTIIKEDRNSKDITYEVSKYLRNDPKRYVSRISFIDYIPWMNLASLFDVENHKIAVVEYNGERQEVEVFESYKEDVIPIEDKPGYYKVKPGYWVKCYYPVDSYKANGYAPSYISSEYIVEIKDKVSELS